MSALSCICCTNFSIVVVQVCLEIRSVTEVGGGELGGADSPVAGDNERRSRADDARGLKKRGELM